MIFGDGMSRFKDDVRIKFGGNEVRGTVASEMSIVAYTPPVDNAQTVAIEVAISSFPTLMPLR